MPTTISPGAPVQAPCALAAFGRKVTKTSAATVDKIKLTARMDISLNATTCTGTTPLKVKFAQAKSQSGRQTAYPRAAGHGIDFVKPDKRVTLPWSLSFSGEDGRPVKVPMEILQSPAGNLREQGHDVFLMSEAFSAFGRQLTGDESIRCPDCQASLYPPNNFLDLHDDSATDDAQRVAAYRLGARPSIVGWFGRNR